VRGDAFELGADLSEAAREHVEAAWRELTALCEQPTAVHWRAAAAGGGAAGAFA
jgi:hypothetical protein